MDRFHSRLDPAEERIHLVKEQKKTSRLKHRGRVEITEKNVRDKGICWSLTYAEIESEKHRRETGAEAILREILTENFLRLMTDQTTDSKRSTNTM